MTGSIWSTSGMVRKSENLFRAFKLSFSFNQRWAMLKTRPRTNYKSYRPKRENESVILASLLRRSQDLDKEGMGP